ncbi:molybdenum cofactor biosynthesis protein MoaC [Salinarchaeum sp. Harcht-Bsk1]|uniref:cyclic pyranopterin monophosphate synthase MoaC n=1 Tax=Salinarchaeum sp. Harcht-Bsk1 TaxID=1333523 RepID=UPI0003424457|nr:cyclic pyranopterin monophosphate synthase MoaC [Salinarchaeum sp. Harcht-Bsk1]AGN00516.1 molybdenum cofactor biosynthesis protein MoaC [Salinarchaeum sp. Harcht-Bsk1]
MGEEGASGEDPDDLTHTDAEGAVDMVDVGDKPDTARRAVARGRLRLQPSTIEAITASEIEKGDVLATARVGAIQAVKHTWETIPLCHQIPITNVETTFDLHDGPVHADGDGDSESAVGDVDDVGSSPAVELTVAVETTGKTGCEMEALEGVTTGLNVVWDMVKSAEKDADGGYPTAQIEGVGVVEKTKRPLE